jgi:hypothetical protein
MFELAKTFRKERRLMAGLGTKPENKVLAQPSWPDEVYRVLKQAGVRQVGMVPMPAIAGSFAPSRLTRRHASSR